MTDTPDALVWRVCHYLRNYETGAKCACCPAEERDIVFGPFTRGCYAKAAAVVKIVTGADT